ncbi:hypothetical protein BJX61DRAFT_323750 [Aspergillus egyptiacus]|nr:hypothetical protein BJX61DRAFT_323750 [Aspergillus egyptiacus]
MPRGSGFALSAHPLPLLGFELIVIFIPSAPASVSHWWNETNLRRRGEQGLMHPCLLGPFVALTQQRPHTNPPSQLLLSFPLGIFEVSSVIPMIFEVKIVPRMSRS